MYMYGHKRHSKTVFKSRRSFIFLKWLILFLISSPCKEYYMYISYSVFGKRLLHVNYMYSWPGFMECKRKCTRAYLSRAKMTPPPPSNQCISGYQIPPSPDIHSKDLRLDTLFGHTFTLLNAIAQR